MKVIGCCICMLLMMAMLTLYMAVNLEPEQSVTVTSADYKLYSLTYEYEGDHKILYVIAESFEQASTIHAYGPITSVRKVDIPIVMTIKGGTQ